jgi:hypothetical protein
MQDRERVEHCLIERTFLLKQFDLFRSGLGGTANLLPGLISIAVHGVDAELGHKRLST